MKTVSQELIDENTGEQASKRKALLAEANSYKSEIDRIEIEHINKQRTLNERIQTIKKDLTEIGLDDLLFLSEFAVNQNNHNSNLVLGVDVKASSDRTIVLAEIELISSQKLKFYSGFLKNKNKKFLTDSQQAKTYFDLVKTISITALKALAVNLSSTPVHTVSVNVSQTWVDRATGKDVHGIISSLQSSIKQINEIDLTKVEASPCYSYLKGIIMPSVAKPSKIRPIFELDKSDGRIVKTKDVLDETSEGENLALMHWEDFEHLVAQIFELEFASDGTEVKVTQSSRDKGVDAILFDPNPLKGGKYVLQAKRYTNVVGVSAVRDLYGTILNEGANRGILITTATFGSDAYEFAKNKPISLVDGPNLLNLLAKHDLNYVINLDEVKQDH